MPNHMTFARDLTYYLHYFDQSVSKSFFNNPFLIRFSIPCYESPAMKISWNVTCDAMALFDKLFSLKRKLDDREPRNRDRYVMMKWNAFHSFYSIFVSGAVCGGGVDARSIHPCHYWETVLHGALCGPSRRSGDARQSGSAGSATSMWWVRGARAAGVGEPSARSRHRERGGSRAMFTCYLHDM